MPPEPDSVPFAGAPVTTTFSVSPSLSVSLSSTAKRLDAAVEVESSSTVKGPSPLATGAVPDCTVIVTVPVSVRAPSLTV